MYKFTNHLANAKLVLVRKQLDGTCAALVLTRQRRPLGTNPPENCPKPTTPPKSRKLLYGTLGAVLLTGGAVVYAKNSPEARNWLESNMPIANDFIALVYQENTTYWKTAVNKFNSASTSLGHLMFGKEGVVPVEVRKKTKEEFEAEAKINLGPKNYQLPPPAFEPLYIEEPKIVPPEVHQPATLIQTDKSDPQAPMKIEITKDLVELEQDMHDNTRIAVDNYKEAVKHAERYNKALYKIVESPIENLDNTLFKNLQSAQNDLKTTETTAKNACAKARCAIETIDRMLKAGVKAPPESIASTKRYLKQFREDLSRVETAFNQEKEKALLSDKYWEKVEHARQTYKRELQALFPGLDLSARKLDVRGDTDLLLLYTLRQVAYLQNEIAELHTVRELKMNRAIECHDEKKLIEAKVEDMIKKEQLEKDKEFNKKILEVHAEAARQMKEQLKKQYEVQQDVMQAALARKEQEVISKFGRQVSEQVEKERVIFKRELAAMAGKLQAIEQTLKQRAKAEAEARRSQSLWAAAEALLAATRRPAAQVSVDKELQALEKAGKNDKLVETVLKGIPKDARNKGIITEKTLRDRFDLMEQNAVKVALVGRNGASLPIYFLSWLQSKLLFPKLAEIPQDELDNLPTDFSQLDTFDIIQRARYYMDHGNLPAALRYINLLQGGPRAAAVPWLESARAHLEIKQAAEAVMAHASVSGLLYL
ncbi:MICOS complex subunit Mic60 [Cydia strobilella]|uniref:MICOS complex subunit Mic60 n=1 Tax=Cydia strobilella TaxID=1100964 RepID=UPI003003EFB1